MSMFWKLNTQNSNSSYMEHISMFNDHINIILILNMIMISYWTMSNILKSSKLYDKTENNSSEIFWTSIPLLMLMFISFPSLLILYMTEEFPKTSNMMKATGNQWFWSYEIPSNKNFISSSFMNSSTKNRNISNSEPTMIFTNINNKILTTSNDVIHSWTIPSFGVKMDSIPGRTNACSINPKRSGLFSGQCSEICGMNHSLMPILLQSSKPKM